MDRLVKIARKEYRRYDYMVHAYPKAAKKRRIRKKWRRRFPRIDLGDILFGDNPLLGRPDFFGLDRGNTISSEFKTAKTDYEIWRNK